MIKVGEKMNKYDMIWDLVWGFGSVVLGVFVGLTVWVVLRVT